MSSELTTFEASLPSYLKGVPLDETTKALAGGGGGNKRISIRGSVFRMVVDGKEIAKNENRSMNIVIVKAAEHISRQFYKKQWDPEAAAEAPDCWSADGKAPAADVPKPQSPACATCPQNIAGSGQGQSRACRYQQRLAVVLEGDMEGNVYQLSLPATSLFGEAKGVKMPLQAYGRYLAGHNIPVTAVVTEMKFDTDVEAPKLTFRPLRPLSEEEYLNCKDQGATPDALSAVTVFVAKRDTANAPQPVTNAGRVAAPVEEEEADEPTPPPKVRQAKKEAEVPKSQSIADVLNSWDDSDED